MRSNFRMLLGVVTLLIVLTASGLLLLIEIRRASHILVPTYPTSAPPLGEFPTRYPEQDRTGQDPLPAAVLLPTVTPTPQPTATPTPAFREPASAARLTGIQHVWQTWNNCGPATLAMNLSYFGVPSDQEEIGRQLRPNPNDKNVSPGELADFARSMGYQALVRVNGNAGTLRTLLSNGVPVLIESWLEPEPGDGLGHYRLLTGYDDAGAYWIAYDTYVGAPLVNPAGEYAGIRLDFAETDRLWRVFHRTYLVVYTEEQAPMVAAILGDEADERQMWRNALATAQAEIDVNPADPFAWFNVGTSFAALEEFSSAAHAYDRALGLGLPWRMLWYQFGPFQAFYHAGRHQDVIQLASATLAPAAQIEELHYWRSRSLTALGEPHQAAEAWQQAQALNPAFLSRQETASPPAVSVQEGL